MKGGVIKSSVISGSDEFELEAGEAAADDMRRSLSLFIGWLWSEFNSQPVSNRKCLAKVTNLAQAPGCSSPSDPPLTKRISYISLSEHRLFHFSRLFKRNVKAMPAHFICSTI